MKIAFAWCVVGCLALSHVTVSRAEGSSGDIEKAITALEMRWAQAETANTPDQIQVNSVDARAADFQIDLRYPPGY